MHSLNFPSFFYFFGFAHRGMQAAMVATLSNAITLGKRADWVGKAAAVDSDSVLMHRHRAHIPSSPLMINQQPVVDRLDMVVRHIAKRLVRQIGGSLEKGIANIFAHGAIIGCNQAGCHSYFPVVVFVHGETVPMASANKNVRGATQ